LFFSSRTSKKKTHFSKRAQAKLSKRPQPPQNAKTPGSVNVAKRPFWHRGLVILLCLVFAGGGTWAVMEYYVFNTLPPELVGKWVVQEGEQEGATFDFFRNGSMRGRINLRGREGIIDARVRVENGTLLSTTRNPNTGANETRTQQIVTLNATSLVLKDDRGQVLRLQRAE
jgi:hypothetical protein